MSDAGNVYVVDFGDRIRKITPAGNVSTLAGGIHGFANGTGTAAEFSLPGAIAVDATENVYVADQATTGSEKLHPVEKLLR